MANPASAPSPSGATNMHESPMPQPQSKRDKRRQMLSEKLADISATFGANRKQHYQDQLRGLEIDMNLIMRAEPYADRPLIDDGEEIGDVISIMTGAGAGGAGADDASTNVGSLAGKYYSKFADEVNTAMEDRDRDLTMTFNFYQNGLDELHRSNQYKILLAQEEHNILCKTLRDRLITTVGHKRARLLKEKEQLDIADSNALLLNPNQFTINPSSPSGNHNRKTRNTRLRPGDDENTPSVEGNKRKRKADEDETTPLFRNLENGSATPLRDAKSKLVRAQYEAPLYSIDRLFTEKELAMTMSRAHLAATEKARAQETQAANGGTSASSTRNANMDEDGTGTAANASTVEGDVDSDAPGAVPGSPDGGPAQIVHATRSSNRQVGLGDLASAASIIPPYAINIGITSTKANTAAPPPPPLTDSQIRDDLADISRRPDEIRNDDLLERACEKKLPLGASALPAYLQNDWGDDRHGFDAEGMGLRAQIMARTSSGMGGVAMSKQSSMGGASDLGGSMMRRSISAADYGVRGKGRA